MLWNNVGREDVVRQQCTVLICAVFCGINVTLICGGGSKVTLL
jgi:hypothetical protein